MTLLLGELATISEVETELNEQKVRNDNLLTEKENLEDRCDSLCRDKNAENMAKIKVDAEINKLRTENINLHSYIEGLGQEIDFHNNGEKLCEVGERHQRRKLIEVKTKWFAKSFGLDLQSAVFVGKHGGNHNLSYSEKVLTSYMDLSEVDQEKVKSMLFILHWRCSIP